MAKKKKIKLPPKPAFGSIERNKIIRAIHEDKENPVTDTEKAIRFYNGAVKGKEFCAKGYGEAPYFALSEPDEYEETPLMSLVLDELNQQFGIE